MILDFKNFNINALQPNNPFEEEVLNFLLEWFSPAKTVHVSTSGSTGKPKILEIEKKRMLHSAQRTCDFFHLQEGDAACLCLPVAYISGKMMVVRAIERKLKLEIQSPSTKPLTQLLSEVDFSALTPLQVESSLDEIYKIKNLIIGGAQVSESLKLKIAQKLEGTAYTGKIFETYGMSETLSHIALKQIFPQAEAYFTVLEGVEIAQDARGCLKINAPELTLETLQTNDIVELKDSRHFRFLGRADFVINTGGAKIFPEQLEIFIKKELAKNGVEGEVLISSQKDEVLGQKLVLFMECEENNGLREAVLNLPYKNRYEKPKEIIFLQAFHRSENGKILRKKFQ